MFFGYWKRRAQRLQDAVWELEERVSELEAERQSLNRDARKAEDELRAARNSISGEGLLLAAERQDNETLRRKLKSVQADADHAQRCYEQCEIDRKAIAAKLARVEASVQRCSPGVVTARQERDAAFKERDQWRETAEHASALVGRTFAACERFMSDLSKLREATDARTDAVDPESGEAADQAGARAATCPENCGRCFAPPYVCTRIAQDPLYPDGP